MAENIENSTELVPCKLEEQPILANLFQLYAHDFSGFYDVDLGPEGRYIYTPLPLYWSEPTRFPFLVKVNGELAGFALVKRGSDVSGDPEIWDMAEFFVIRKHRRHGVGTRIAHQVWRRFPGRWEVRVLQLNDSAKPFWERAIAQFTGTTIQPVPFEKESDAWNVFSFESPA